MKLGLKIILPLLMLVFIVGGSLSYLLYSLTLQGRTLTATTEKIQKLNSLVEQLNQQRYRSEISVLSYRFRQEQVYLDTISQADLDGAKILDQMSFFINSAKGREVIKNYIEAKHDLVKTRNELINAIVDNNTESIALNFNRWSLQVQNIRAALADINAFNINSIEGTVITANQLRDQVAQIILALMVIVFVVLIIAAWTSNRFIIKPIIELVRATEKISRADFTTSSVTILNSRSNDEIGQLTSSFKVMAEKLKESYGVLEKKVKERTAHLEDANAKDEALLSSIGDGLVVTDTDGKIILVNQMFEKLVGWNAQDVLGKSLPEVVPMTDMEGRTIPKSARFITKTLREKTATTSTTAVQYKRKDGSAFPVAITVSPVISGRNFLGAVEVFRDITKEKEVDKAKTEFVSLASHQLRTPLTSINWYAEMLMAGDAGKLTKDQQNFVEEMYKGSRRMVDLVNSLLNVSRIDLGTFAVDPEPTDVRELITSVLSDVKPQVLAKKLQINTEFDPAVQLYSADPKLMRIIVQNLITNAVKYTAEGGAVTIFLNSKNAKLKTKGELLFTVKDNGCGIPKNQQDKIFTKLFRADNAKEIDNDGNGLGMYLVKSIVNEVKGKIWFESEEDKGTTFYVSLPLSGMSKKEGAKTLDN